MCGFSVAVYGPTAWSHLLLTASMYSKSFLLTRDTGVPNLILIAIPYVASYSAAVQSHN